MAYYYYENEELKSAASPSKIPEHIDVFCNLSTAIFHVQQMGCARMNLHKIADEFHQLCFDVLKLAVQEQGEDFPVVLRGVRSTRPDSEYKIMFATTSQEVAAFYGEVREYRNIRGLRTLSIAKSVITDDYDQMDEEIIFFPN